MTYLETLMEQVETFKDEGIPNSSIVFGNKFINDIQNKISSINSISPLFSF